MRLAKFQLGSWLVLVLGQSQIVYAEHGQALSPPARVIGGTEVPACAWPSTVYMATSFCTGTLIHPKVVVTAAHCMPPETGESVRFGESYGQVRLVVKASKCVSSGSTEQGKDWAYCILEREVTEVPFAPPLYGCELEKHLKVGAKVQVVGFGDNIVEVVTTKETITSGGGFKREAEVLIQKIDPAFGIEAWDIGKSGCFGDSGGPLFLHLKDDRGQDAGWRTVAITHGRLTEAPATDNCVRNEIYTSVSKLIPQLERDEGIDVTPCTDSAGQWDPTRCSGFQLEPSKGGGNWPRCEVGPVSGPVSTCGVDTGGASGAGGNAGTTGESAGAGGSGGGGTPNSPPTDPNNPKENGCGCRAVPASQGHHWGVIIGLNVLGYCMRMRKRRVHYGNCH